MKRWMLLLLLLVIVMLAVSLLVLRQRLASSSQLSPSHLARTPHSAYKYDLCIEAFAYARHIKPTTRSTIPFA